MAVGGRYTVKYGAFRLLMSAMGSARSFRCRGRRRPSHRADGWGFSAQVPRSAIRSAERTHGLVGGIGVHGWRGRWLVNGAASGLVMVRFDPAQRRSWASR